MDLVVQLWEVMLSSALIEEGSLSFVILTIFPGNGSSSPWIKTNSKTEQEAGIKTLNIYSLPCYW